MADKGQSGIYAIINTKSGRVYIGSTTNFEQRWIDHKRALNNGGHHNTHLQRAWNKYSKTAFRFIICEYVNNLDNLISREQYWLDLHRIYVSVYNIALTVDRSIFSDEARRKISKAAMGNQHALGCKHSKEAIQKARDYRHTEEAKHKISIAQIGNQHALGRTYKRSKETRLKMSITATARWARVREEANREE